jgi:hypothetical protein
VSRPFEARENLNQANKLSRTYATLIEALNRHRGKGQQKVDELVRFQSIAYHGDIVAQ